MALGKTNHRIRRNRRNLQSTGPGSKVVAIWTPENPNRPIATQIDFNAAAVGTSKPDEELLNLTSYLFAEELTPLPTDKIFVQDMDTGSVLTVISATWDVSALVSITVAESVAGALLVVIPPMIPNWELAQRFVFGGLSAQIGITP